MIYFFPRINVFRYKSIEKCFKKILFSDYVKINHGKNVLVSGSIDKNNELCVTEILKYISININKQEIKYVDIHINENIFIRSYGNQTTEYVVSVDVKDIKNNLEKEISEDFISRYGLF